MSIIAGTPLKREPGIMDVTMLHKIEEIIDKRGSM